MNQQDPYDDFDRERRVLGAEDCGLKVRRASTAQSSPKTAPACCTVPRSAGKAMPMLMVVL